MASTVRVVSGLLNEAHHRVEGLEGVVQEDILLGEDRELALQVPERRRQGRREGFHPQLGPRVPLGQAQHDPKAAEGRPNGRRPRRRGGAPA